MSITRRFDALDDDALVSSLTIGQFKEMISFQERNAKLAELEKQYRESVMAIAEVQKDAKKIFKDQEQLSMASTPFRLRTELEVEKFVENVRKVVADGNVVLTAIAVEASDG